MNNSPSSIPMWNKHSTLGWISAAQTAWKFARPWWGWILLGLFVNTICALFEGGTLGLVTVALQVLGNPDPLATNPFLGPQAERLEWLRGQFGKEELFLGLILLAILSQMLRSGFQFLGVVLTARVRMQVQAQATHEVYSRILRLSFPQVSSYRLGDLTDYLQQPAHLSDLFGRVNDLVRNLLFLVAYAALLFWLSWPLMGVALVAYGAISRLMALVMRRVAQHGLAVRQGGLTLTQKATESFQALRILHSFHRQEEEIRSMADLLEQNRSRQERSLFWVNLPEPITDFLTVAGVGLFLILGHALMGPGRAYTLPSLLAFLVAMHRVTPRLRALYAQLAALTYLAPNIARMNEILSQALPKLRGARPFRRLCRSIEFQRVCLWYASELSPAVSDLSFSIPRGSFTALVGLSGGGKSTVANLLLRLHPPSDGVILVDGTPLTEIDRGDWLERVGSVAQEPFLFHASIRDNIAFGKPDATQAQVAWAAQAAHADLFVGKLASGYDTLVGERGQRLSGGELQRIALARALVRQPDLLILDEATSALDSDSERQIQQALEEQRRTRTILAIAHRLSTIAYADRILVLAEGRLVEQGTHVELLSRDGIYAHLWKLQSESRPEWAKEMPCESW